MQGIGIILAWPETKCKQSGAWFDKSMKWVGFNKNGYYKVGHAAICLINANGDVHYFDFGRYHAPHGFGRIRSAETDFDLQVKTKVEFNKNNLPINIEEVITELQNNTSCHGDGKLHYSTITIDFELAIKKAKEMQKAIFLPYGPFVFKGTNCSRFVRSVAKVGALSPINKIALTIPPMVTPTPAWNVTAGKLSPSLKLNIKQKLSFYAR